MLTLLLEASPLWGLPPRLAVEASTGSLDGVDLAQAITQAIVAAVDEAILRAPSGNNALDYPPTVDILWTEEG